MKKPDQLANLDAEINLLQRESVSSIRNEFELSKDVGLSLLKLKLA